MQWCLLLTLLHCLLSCSRPCFRKPVETQQNRAARICVSFLTVFAVAQKSLGICPRLRSHRSWWSRLMQPLTAADFLYTKSYSTASSKIQMIATSPRRSSSLTSTLTTAWFKHCTGQRHEIADNSISRRLPISWWKTATEKELTEEIAGMREILRKWGYVNADDVKGYRAPYIQIGGNTEFKILKDLGFMFESSMPTQMYRDPPLWPYTLEYRSTQDCVIEPCPTGKLISFYVGDSDLVWQVSVAALYKPGINWRSAVHLVYLVVFPAGKRWS